MQRYFRATESKYEALRRAMDEVLGLPNQRSDTAITPAATAPRNASGHVLVAVAESLHQQPGIDALLDNGNATEITEAEYAASVMYPFP